MQPILKSRLVAALELDNLAHKMQKMVDAFT
jgi:hypothetical protein